MAQVTMHQAKTQLSRLVHALETGAEREIIIARGKHPVARLVALRPGDTTCRIGVAAGQFDVPDEIDVDNDAIAALFGSAP